MLKTASSLFATFVWLLSLLSLDPVYRVVLVLLSALQLCSNAQGKQTARDGGEEIWESGCTTVPAVWVDNVTGRYRGLVEKDRNR